MLETISLALLIFLALQISVRNYRVELSSMESTLLPRDRVVVNKLLYFLLDVEEVNRLLPFVDIDTHSDKIFPFHSPSRGEIIVFRFPRDTSRDFVKRVIGLPGDVVSINNGQVFIDGNPLDEPYLVEKYSDTLSPTLVAPDSYFVMGDNRDQSSDSRDWGTVPLENIVGKTWVRYWPLSEFSFLSGGRPTVVEGTLR